MSACGRILAIDFGRVRLGLALSDAAGITAQPFATYQRVGPRKDVGYLARIVAENDVRRIVLGLPLRLSGEEGPEAEAVRTFGTRLAARLPGVPVDYEDERFSTVEAERVLVEGGARRRERRQTVDRMAAVLILQSVLDRRADA